MKHVVEVVGSWWFQKVHFEQLENIVTEECTAIKSKATAILGRRVAVAVRKAKRSSRYTELPTDDLKEQYLNKIRETIRSRVTIEHAIKLELRSADGGVLVFHSIADALANCPTMFKIADARLSIRCCDGAFFVTFPESTPVVHGPFGLFRLSDASTRVACVSHATQPDLRAMMNALCDRIGEWARQSQLPVRYRLWNRHRVWIVLAIPAVFCALSTIFPKKEPIAMKAEAQQLLAEGITDSNQHRATELILRYSAQEPRVVDPYNWNGIIGYSIFACLVVISLYLLIAPPGNKLPFGKGVAACAIQEKMYRIVKYPIRVLFLGSVTLGIVSSVIYDMIKRLFGL